MREAASQWFVWFIALSMGLVGRRSHLRVSRDVNILQTKLNILSFRPWKGSMI